REPPGDDGEPVRTVTTVKDRPQQHCAGIPDAERHPKLPPGRRKNRCCKCAESHHQQRHDRPTKPCEEICPCDSACARREYQPVRVASDEHEPFPKHRERGYAPEKCKRPVPKIRR